MSKKYQWGSKSLRQRSDSVNKMAIVVLLLGVAAGALRNFIPYPFITPMSMVLIGIAVLLMSYTEGIKWADSQTRGINTREN